MTFVELLHVHVAVESASQKAVYIPVHLQKDALELLVKRFRLSVSPLRILDLVPNRIHTAIRGNLTFFSMQDAQSERVSRLSKQSKITSSVANFA